MNVFFTAFSAVGTILYIVIKIYEIYRNKKFSNNNFFCFLCIVSVAYLASTITPPEGWDLLHHYHEIDRIRKYGLDYAIEYSRYRTYPAATALFYLVSLTDWNGMLIFISIGTELCILEDVTSYYQNKHVPIQTVNICFFIIIIFSNIVLAISGIRNVLAVYLMEYAIWKYHMKNGRRIFQILLMIIAMTLHPGSGFIAVIYIFSYIRYIKLGTVLSLLFLPCVQFIISHTSLKYNGYFGSSLGLLNLYLENNIKLDWRIRITTTIVLVAALILIAYRIFRMHDHTHYLRLMGYYIVATLGVSSFVIVYMRMLYGAGWCCMALLTADYAVNDVKKKTDRKYIQYIKIFLVICMIYIIGMTMFQGLELFNAIQRAKG